MPELAHVCEIVVSGQALLADPIHCFRQLSLCDPDARFLRRDGMNIWDNAPDMQSLGFVEQIYGTLQIALGQAKSSPSNAAAVRRLA